MRKWKRFSLIVLVAALLLLVAAVVAALALEPAAPAATDLSWKVIASGGATMSSPNYTMLSTAGQPVTGTSSSANYAVLSGYWYGFQEFVRTLFLPLVTG